MHEQGTPAPTMEQQAVEQQNNGNRKRGVFVLLASGAALALAGLSLVNCDGDEKSKDTTEVSAADPANDETDRSLSEGNFMCGGEKGMTSMTDFGYKYDFFTATEGNKELAHSVLDVTVTDEQWGMGDDAFKLVINNMLVNPNTETADRTTGSEGLDKLIPGLFSRELTEDTTYINGDCRNVENQVSMPSPDKPVINLKKGSTTEGVMLPMSKYQEFMDTVNKDENGNVRFLIVTGIIVQDAEGKDVEVFFVDLFANGCDNPIRVPHGGDTSTTVPNKIEAPAHVASSVIGGPDATDGGDTDNDNNPGNNVTTAQATTTTVTGTTEATTTTVKSETGNASTTVGTCGPACD